jgi:hypothetical protein
MTWDEIEELACLMLKRDYDSIVDEGNESYIEELFYETYNVTLEEFESVLYDLIKFTNPWKSPITNEIYQGFVVNTKTEGLMRAIIKEKMND